MTINKNWVNITLGIAGIVSLVLLVTAVTVSANPSRIVENRSAAATTTLSYLSAGRGTTTVTFDIQSDDFPADSATLAIQYTGSSSPLSQLGWRYDFSQNGVDWFAETVSNSANTATTSEEVRTNKDYLWRFSSTTLIEGGTSDVARKLINLPTPTRYVRVTFFVPTGTQPGAIWTNLIFKKQNR